MYRFIITYYMFEHFKNKFKLNINNNNPKKK